MAMTVKQDGNPLYRGIVDDIRARIRDGEMRPGDQIPTIEGICASYNVSPITAKRAINDLQTMGLVRSIRGKGTFVAPRDELPAIAGPYQPIERVALMVSPRFRPGSHTGFFGLTWEAIERAAEQRKLGFTVHAVPAGGSDFHVDLTFQPDPLEGLVFLTTDYPYRIMHLVHERRLAAVTIDAASALCHAVLSDNLDGMRQVIDHLRALGHERVLLATRDPRSPNPTNENERTAAFQFLAADRGLQGQTLLSTDPGPLISRVRKKNGPTALVFAQEQPAHDFIRAAREVGLNVPRDVSVCGFDGWCHEPLLGVELTTFAVDRAALGCGAVDFLVDLSRGRFPSSAQWVRVKGQFQAGKTTAAPRRSA